MTIDVIIPVYRGLDETRRCIESVLASRNKSAAHVVVIDDDTPEPGIADYLDALSESGAIQLLRNTSNLGFVASVNRGMALHPDRDVILLNSDTEVANDWIDRLSRTARASPDIGTVTPFSNNATICSYPYEGWAGDLPGSLGLADLDALFARIHPGRTVDLPTAVGFCMYIRRDCLNQVGLFDAAAFGRGYGEENDFCMRASAAGWRNVLAADVFVFHKGSVSFSDERFALMQSAQAALLERHPDYMARVHDFIRRDPVAGLREEIDHARAGIGADEARHVADEQARRKPACNQASPAGMRIACIVVVYDEAIDPQPTVMAVQPQVERVIVVDNAVSSHPRLSALSEFPNVTVLANRNRGGLAGAYNLALEYVSDHFGHATHILFLDDDSDATVVGTFLNAPSTQQALQMDDVAAVAPLYVERATGLPGAHIQLGRFRYRVLPRELDQPTAVTFLINSMSLWKKQVLAQIGPYSVQLGVDHVDTDYCLRAKTLGYRLILNPAVRFRHSIGKRRQYRLFGRTLQAGGHSPTRRRSIGRNTMLLAKHYFWTYPAFTALCLMRLAYECVGIVLAEPRKLNKLASLARGAAAGLFAPYRR